MNDIGNRHSGDAGRALKNGGRAISVEVRLGTDAHLPAVQHTAWMLLNLLSRLKGAVSEIRLHCPEHIKSSSRLSPLVSSGHELLNSALRNGITAIGTDTEGFVPLRATPNEPAEIIIHVGFGFDSEATFCAIGNGWCGGIFSRQITTAPDFSELTIGPYIAACIAAGEVFRYVRLIDYEAERQLFLSALDYEWKRDPDWVAVEEIRIELPRVLIAGVGAVGCAVLHALFPLHVSGSVLLADNDTKGIDDTNLGRYCLFGVQSIGKQKATEAVRLVNDAEFSAVAHDGGFEHFFALEDKPTIVLSAVDVNESRHAVQEQYPPLILSASTHNLRAEVLRCGPPGKGACLACFNPLKTPRRTEDEIRELLREKPEMIATLCDKLGLDEREAASWIRERKCSQTGERLIEELRTDDGSVPSFSVGFVSVLAGVLLAAELLKVAIGSCTPLNEKINRAVFQFHTPAAVTNRARFYPREELCVVCSESNAALPIWNRRYQAFIDGMKAV